MSQDSSNTYKKLDEMRRKNDDINKKEERRHKDKII
jgi:hypothetical protein